MAKGRYTNSTRCNNIWGTESRPKSRALATRAGVEAPTLGAKVWALAAAVWELAT